MTKKGIVLEILYSKSIEGYFLINLSLFIIDSYQRRTVLSNAMNIIYSTKGKNIIFSSGSESYLTHRSPYDIVAL